MFRGNVLFFISCVAAATTFECGQRIEPTRHKRIINGYKAERWPWMVYMRTEDYDGNKFSCGGSVIGSRWVLTARHCVDNRKNIRLVIEDGHTRDIDDDKWMVHRNGIEFTRYEDLYETEHIWRSEHMHDIAVIELDQPLEFNERVQPICLPSRIDPIYEKGAELVTIGHGDKRPSTSIAHFPDNILREMKFIADEPAQCKERLLKEHEVQIFYLSIFAAMKKHKESRSRKDFFKTFLKEQKTQTFNLMPSIDEEIRLNICAKKNDKGAVTCYGDSGSPAMLQTKDKRWFQFGLTTHGTIDEACDEPNVVDFFANVVEHCEFITIATKGEVKCIDVKA